MSTATIFGRSSLDGASLEVTRTILQPIVADRQQLIRATRATNLQPMVATTKIGIQEAFAKRLKGLLDEAGAPERGRPQWLSDRFNRVFSRESARKWLDGESMPSEAHKAMLCASFGWSVDYLQSGIGPMYAGLTDPDLAEIIDGWRMLDEEGRRGLMRQFRNERDMHGIKPPPPNPPSHTPRKGRR